jgi:hypothetical protein
VANGKRLVIFLHIPKTAGSSAWHTLANSVTSLDNERISVVDADHEARMKIMAGSKESISDLASQAVDRFVEYFNSSIHQIMFLHLHTTKMPPWQLYMSVDVIMLYRLPEDRLKSAFKHWVGGSPATNLKRENMVKILRWHCNSLFGFLSKLNVPFLRARLLMNFFNEGTSSGVDVYLDEILKINWQYKSNFGLPSNVRLIPFAMEDAIHSNSNFHLFIQSEYGVIMPKLLHLDLTKTDRGELNNLVEKFLEINHIFKKQFQARCLKESNAIFSMLKNGKF